MRCRKLYWDLGIVFAHLAEHSGEALDWHQAIEAFQLAHSFEDKLPSDFWTDFGHACLKFAAQINDIRFYVKAIQCLKNAVSMTREPLTVGASSQTHSKNSICTHTTKIISHRQTTAFPPPRKFYLRTVRLARLG